MLVLTLFFWKRGVVTSGVIFITLLMLAVCAGVELYTRSNEMATSDDPTQLDIANFVVYLVYFILVVVQLVLFAFAESPSFCQSADKLLHKPCPENYASFPCRVTFWWITPLVWLGFKRPLTVGDISQLRDEDKSGELIPSFEAYWKKAIVDYTRRKSKAIGSSAKPSTNETINERTHILSATKDTPLPSPPSLVWCFIRMFKGDAFISIFLHVVCDVLLFMNPVILSQLIRMAEDPETPSWHGYFFAGLLFVSAQLYSLLEQQYYYRSMRAGMDIRSVLVSALIKKTLKLSSKARRSYTAGEIVNLMAVDAARIQDSTFYLLQLITQPFFICLTVYWLWTILGTLATVAGISTVVLLIPVSIWLSVKQNQLQALNLVYKDSRLKVMCEILNGIKVLKLYAWEPPFLKKINKIRECELIVLLSTSYLVAASMLTFISAPFLITLASFTTYILSDPSHVLTAEVTFVSILLLQMLRMPLMLFPEAVSTIIWASVANTRIKHFLVADELDQHAIELVPENALGLQQVFSKSVREGVIAIQNASFTWNGDDPKRPTLTSINLNVRKGSLVAVIGGVGAGKSSLLNAVLGEMERVSGRVFNKGDIAYVAQQAWIQNDTIRNNIVFQKPYDEDFYNLVVKACALDPDFAILPAGDMTEIGEKGINLSGGQKQRISIARAVYQQRDIYLFDDPLSAVDAHVGKHIFKKVIGNDGLLKDRTRILVTNGLSFIKHVDQIVVMKSGSIAEAGSYSDVMQKGSEFENFLVTFVTQEMTNGKNRQKKLITDLAVSDETKPTHLQGNAEVPATKSKRSQKENGEDACHWKSGDDVKGQLIADEKMETKQAPLGTYLFYAKAMGYIRFAGSVFLWACGYALSIGANYWLASWSNKANLEEEQFRRPPFEYRPNDTSRPVNDAGVFLGVYTTLGSLHGLFVFISAVLMTYSMNVASAKLHSGLVMNILRSPMSFFETTPLGRILNRCGKDIDVVDTQLRPVFAQWIGAWLGLAAPIITVTITTPIFLVALLPLSYAYYTIQRVFLPANTQLRRIETVTLSPLYSNFQEAISGSTTIRAYGAQTRYTLRSEMLVDRNNSVAYARTIANRWCAMLLQTLGNLVVFCAAVIAVYSRERLSSGLIGLSISYAMQVSQMLAMAVRAQCELESNIVAVERIKEYSDTPTEAAWELSETPPEGWPSRGCVELKDYTVSYRSGLEPVLRGISCTIQPGEKIGIAGRTGAGKSSLVLALFRLIEADHGTIVIDEVDIASLGLHSVRSRITIIPQDPVIFSGTVRSNLDPFEGHTDAELWSALEQAHIKSGIEKLPAGLEYSLMEGGEDLSVGQRQLICLARAILRKTKILVLDEATAAIDLETDELIQQTIRRVFADCTVITIAHRLNTIMDSSRILVLDDGSIVELDSPSALLSNKDGAFYRMAKEAGLVA